MIRSMYSGIAGLKNFQTKLDVIGNNIANVNTFGFKKGRVTFQEAMNQTTQAASGAADGRGGINPKQIGLGSVTATIDTVQTQASLQTTGRTLDLAINGDGFFTVEGPTGENYTRAGNFYLDEAGTLVTGDGFPVIDEDDNQITIDSEEYQSFSVSSNGMINGINDAGAVVEIASIKLTNFNNASGLTKVGNNLFQESVNSGAPIDMLGEEKSSISSGTLEMSNVDLSEEFTEMITAQRGFQANTRIITTSDQILEELVNLKR